MPIGMASSPVKMKPVASSSSAKRANLTSSKRAEPAGSRRFGARKTDKLKMAMVVGCFVLAIACLVVGYIVIQQRMEGTPVSKENLEFNLGSRLDRQKTHARQPG